MHEVHDKAIQAALHNDWEAAVEFNLEILVQSPHNVSALNRLGHAYTELGQKDAAKQTYNQVLEIDKYNVVATRNLKLLPHQQNGGNPVCLVEESFIELPGITKSSPLIKVASRDILLSLVCKQQLVFVPRARLLSVTTTTGTYIGCLPDDLSIRLRSLLKSSYSYSLCLKNANDNSAIIFIRELNRPKRPSASPTFSRVVQLKKLK